MAKEEKTEKKQDAKEEELSLPQTKEDYEPTAWAGWAGEGMVAVGGARGAGGAKGDADYANIGALAYAEFPGGGLFIALGGTGTAAVAAGAGEIETRGSDQNDEILECGAIFNGTSRGVHGNPMI